eukprot:scaffold16407_cov53-Phaeocystis_antarctica.AAC.2
MCQGLPPYAPEAATMRKRATVLCGRRLHRVGHARERVAAPVHAERLHRVRVAPPAVQGRAGSVGNQAVARVVEHEDAPVGVAAAVDVHAHDGRGVLGTRGAGSPPGYALDVGELAVARVEVDLRARDHVGVAVAVEVDRGDEARRVNGRVLGRIDAHGRGPGVVRLAGLGAVLELRLEGAGAIVKVHLGGLVAAAHHQVHLAVTVHVERRDLVGVVHLALVLAKREAQGAADGGPGRHVDALVRALVPSRRVLERNGDGQDRPAWRHGRVVAGLGGIAEVQHVGRALLRGDNVGHSIAVEVGHGDVLRGELVLLPLGAENAVRPVVVGQRERLGGRRGQAGLAQDPAGRVLGKEDLVLFVAVSHDEVHLAVLVQVGHDDLSRRRGGMKGTSRRVANWDHVRGPIVAHDNVEVAVAIEVDHLHRPRGRLVGARRVSARVIRLYDRVVHEVRAEDRAWVRRLLGGGVEHERSEVQHVLAAVVDRDDVGQVVTVDVGHHDVDRLRRGRARNWCLDFDGHDGREVVAPRVEVDLSRPIHIGGDEIVEAVVVDVGHLERRHQLHLGEVEALRARREHVACRRRRVVLVLDAAGENDHLGRQRAGRRAGRRELADDEAALVVWRLELRVDNGVRVGVAVHEEVAGAIEGLLDDNVERTPHLLGQQGRRWREG